MGVYDSAILVKIDKDRVVTINGEQYLVVDKVAFKEINEAREIRVYTRSKHLELAVLEILETRPNLRNNQIRSILAEEYEIKTTPNIVRGLLSRMKNKGLIEVDGIKNMATWSLPSNEKED